jgi:DNA-binding IclR family transcriptional regulator
MVSLSEQLASEEGSESRVANASDSSVLEKADRLFRALSEPSSTLGLTELARRSRVPKASTYRLAEQLVDLGFMVKTARGYQLGWRIYEMGQSVPRPAQLRQVARPTLVDLRQATKALVVHFAVLQGDDVVYLERLGGRREVALLAAVGASAPADETVSGRVLQAYRMLTEDRPITSEQEAEYAAIRERRWASEFGSVVAGAKTFAVPIEYPGGSFVIGVIAATVHAGRQDDQVTLHALWAAASEISGALQRKPVR